jgi:hypothetical protein
LSGECYVIGAQPIEQSATDIVGSRGKAFVGSASDRFHKIQWRANMKIGEKTSALGGHIDTVRCGSTANTHVYARARWLKKPDTIIFVRGFSARRVLGDPGVADYLRLLFWSSVIDFLLPLGAPGEDHVQPGTNLIASTHSCRKFLKL